MPRRKLGGKRKANTSPKKAEKKKPRGENTSHTEPQPEAKYQNEKIKDIQSSGKKWALTAKVIQRHDVEELNIPNKQGKIPSYLIGDETGLIKAVGFFESAEKLRSKIQGNKIYEIKDFTVQPTNNTYNNTNHQFEILLHLDTVFEEVLDSEMEVSAESRKKITSQEIKIQEKNQNFKIRGEISEVYEPVRGTNRTTGRSWKYRSVIMTDISGDKAQET